MKAFVEKIKVVSQRTVVPVTNPPSVPNGSYHGTWRGYTVKFDTPIGTCEGTSTVGVRGMNIPCTVSVSSGQFKVTSK